MKRFLPPIMPPWRFLMVAVLLFGLTAVAVENSVLAVPESFGALTLLSVAPHIITPNGDGVNDVTIFSFDSSLAGLPIETAVYDINGARVGSLRINTTQDDQLIWDGKDDGGNVLPGGIYIYSITIGKNQATGTVVIAR